MSDYDVVRAWMKRFGNKDDPEYIAALDALEWREDQERASWLLIGNLQNQLAEQRTAMEQMRADGERLREALAPFANRAAERGMGTKCSALTDRQWRNALETYTAIDTEMCPGGDMCGCKPRAEGRSDAPVPVLKDGYYCCRTYQCTGEKHDKKCPNRVAEQAGAGASVPSVCVACHGTGVFQGVGICHRCLGTGKGVSQCPPPTGSTMGICTRCGMDFRGDGR